MNFEVNKLANVSKHVEATILNKNAILIGKEQLAKANCSVD
ncbi:hypothetical protein [Bacillus nitratireducens]|uniref:Uncharacterized protein n=1 Tax=Bacillus nitratireducens TaxID=2026193 RepID=A0ABU6PKM8_9BACI|nr:hypothetical protein [Bacillus nitratireducens]MED4681858.1 hypothetical protein [Bacillus nitratireducens]